MLGKIVLARLHRIWPPLELAGANNGFDEPSGVAATLRPWVVLVPRREQDTTPPVNVTTAERVSGVGRGLVSHATWVSLAAACCSGLWLYAVKHRTTLIDGDITRTMAATKAAHDRTALLKIEWVSLNEPQRLQGMATQFSALQPVSPQRFVPLAQLPTLLPAPEAMPTGTDIVTADAAPARPAPAVTQAAGVASDVAPAPAIAAILPREDVAAATTPAAAALPVEPAQMIAPTQHADVAARDMPATGRPSVTAQPENIRSAPQRDVTAPAAARMTATTPPAQPQTAAAQPDSPVAERPLMTATTSHSETAQAQGRVGASTAKPPPVADAATSAPPAAHRPVMIARTMLRSVPLPSLRPVAIATLQSPRLRILTPPKGQPARIKADAPPVRIADASPSRFAEPSTSRPAEAFRPRNADAMRTHAAPPSLVHLAMARPAAHGDDALAQFMARLDVKKSVAAAKAHRVLLGRSEPPHNLAVPVLRSAVAVSAPEPAREARAPAAERLAAQDTTDRGDETVAAAAAPPPAPHPRPIPRPSYAYGYPAGYGAYAQSEQPSYAGYGWAPRPYYPPPPPGYGYGYQ